ncbi:MAG: AbrB/MazE/SpoVT family DNA-binding domain-containing protein [Sphingomonadales bacterium]|nr:AbrB/MazE/SpoVT family DNA-binding domain-containing protein [Sphingomonadales bacterium]
MEISLIQIGNSKGIRLPKTIIEKYKFQGSLELVFEKEYIILKPKKKPREGWEKSFQEMRKNGDDTLLIPDTFKDEELEEWK